jgi:hypothetical protein
MKNSLALALILAACLMTQYCCAENASRFQSVGGDYGRSLISSIKSDDAKTEAASNSNGTLWSWGSSPKGTLVVNGNLIGDPTYTMKTLKVVQNWLWESMDDAYGTSAGSYTYLDPETDEEITTYVDPITGEPYYQYTDSVSGKVVNVYFNPKTGVPIRTSFADSSNTEQAQNTTTFVLPPVFRSTTTA